MSDKIMFDQQLAEEIVSIEWDMFYSTQNIGGQASCQQNRAQFEIMRLSQFHGWDRESMEFYLADLKAAAERGENLVTLKYAYMMESTDPAEFSRIVERLPVVDEAKREVVEALVEQTMIWCEDFAARYPHIAAAGRPLRSSADTVLTTSVETYNRGELSSYSMKTLLSLCRHYERMAEEGVNLHERIVEREMLLMGIDSLETAEKLLSRR